MEIISIPEGICPYCNTVFKFSQEDVKYTDGRHVPYINCPVCDGMIFPRKPNNKSSFWKRFFG